MNVTAFASAGAATLAAVVAITLFIVGEIRRGRQAKRERRRAMVVGILDVIDRAVKAQLRPAILRGFALADIEVTLALQRLLLDLPKEELAVSTWVWSRTQQLTLTTDQEEYVRLAVDVQGKLVSWHRGDVEIAWFERQVKESPPLEPFVVPKSVGWLRALRQLPETTKLAVALTLVVKIYRRLFQP